MSGQRYQKNNGTSELSHFNRAILATQCSTTPCQDHSAICIPNLLSCWECEDLLMVLLWLGQGNTLVLNAIPVVYFKLYQKNYPLLPPFSPWIQGPPPVSWCPRMLLFCFSSESIPSVLEWSVVSWLLCPAQFTELLQRKGLGRSLKEACSNATSCSHTACGTELLETAVLCPPSWLLMVGCLVQKADSVLEPQWLLFPNLPLLFNWTLLITRPGNSKCTCEAR